MPIIAKNSKNVLQKAANKRLHKKLQTVASLDGKLCHKVTETFRLFYKASQ